MTVHDSLDELGRRGVEFWFEGDQIRFRAPRGALRPEDRAWLSENRDDVRAALVEQARGRHASHPVSAGQKALWFIQQQAPENSAYHISVPVRIAGLVSAAAMRRAVQVLVDRHASLRTTFAVEDGDVRQIVAGWISAPFEVHLVGDLPDAALRDLAENEAARPFDLAAGPLLRVRLYTLAAEDHVFVITAHHIVADGWSLLTIFDEVTRLYSEFTGGAPAGLAALSTDYVSYTAWHRDLLEGPEGERLWTYWQERMAPPREHLQLPLDREPPPVPTYAGGSVAVPITPALSRNMRDVGASLGVTPFVIWLASFKAFLAHVTGGEDIIVGTPTFGRSRTEFMPVVGNFVNSVPLRSRIVPHSTLRDLAATLRGTVMEALDAQEFPFSRLVQRLHPSRTGGDSPLFNVFFVLQRFDAFKDIQTLLGGDPGAPAVRIGGLSLTPFPLRQRSAQFDLALQMVEVEGGVTAAFWYATDVFDAGTVDRLASEYAAFVAQVASDPDRAFGDAAAPASPPSTPDLSGLLARLDAADIRMSVVDGRLKLDAPKGALDDTLRTQIGASRDALIAHFTSGRGKQGQDLMPVPRTGPVPLSAVQKRLWFTSRLRQDSTQYNVGGALNFSGPLDRAALIRAIGDVLRRHETLRMTIGSLDGEPVARIRAAEEQAPDVSVTQAQDRSEALALAEAFLRRPFGLENDRLSRFLLIQFDQEEHVFAASFHHIVADGWSMSIILEDLSALYEAILADRPARLRMLPVGAVDYAAWENRQTTSGQWRKQIAFWQAELAGAPSVIELPTDRPRPTAPSMRGDRRHSYLDPELVDQLRKFSQRHGATLFMTLFAAWQTLMHRMSGQDDVVVGTPISNREAHGLSAAVGCLVNTVAIRTRFEGQPTFADILRQIRTTVVSAIEQGTVPFDVLVAALNPDRSGGLHPLYQMLFTSLDFPRPTILNSGLRMEALELNTAEARMDITVEVGEMPVGEHAGAFRIVYEYATDLFDSATIERLHAHYSTLLAAIAEDAVRPVHALPLVGAEDERRFAALCNDTNADHDRSVVTHQLTEAVAAISPDRIAVVDSERTWTYAELDAAANRIARALVSKGVTRGKSVAICLDRTAEMPQAALAVMKAGAAYVPLDPSHPVDRLRYIVEDAGAACVITLERFAHLFGDATTLLLDRDRELVEGCSCEPLQAGSRPEDLVYIIYTSGSTGRPKGVEVEHRNLVAFLDAMKRELSTGPDDVVLAVTTLSFDIAGLELWLPLSLGARVVVASRQDALDGRRLADLLQEHHVTLLQATPATWRLLLESGWTGKQDLTALCGGEAMPRQLADALLPRVLALWNMYGPTETTIWSTAGRVNGAPGPISIGHPIPNTRVYVLDSEGRIAPPGVVGELAIAGEGVTRGYHNRPELTARAFGLLTVAGRTERIYRTGDLGRRRSDGSLDYLGRRDQQVKIRGYRIELGEIEAILATHPGVVSSVVAVKTFSAGDDRLVGYATVGQPGALDPDHVRATLRGRLPEYMVPQHFVELPKIPLTPNGKVDRSALPLPPAHVPVSQASLAVPMTEVQRRLVSIWKSVLHSERVGLSDNFFDLGGHSLLLVKLQAAIRAEFGTELSLVELFQHTTVASQAEKLGNAVGAAELVALARARVRGQTS